MSEEQNTVVEEVPTDLATDGEASSESEAIESAAAEATAAETPEVEAAEATAPEAVAEGAPEESPTPPREAVEEAASEAPEASAEADEAPVAEPATAETSAEAEDSVEATAPAEAAVPAETAEATEATAPAEETPAAETKEDFGSALAEFEADKGEGTAAAEGGPKPGERVQGKIVSIGETTAFVDLGTKAEGIVELAELRDDEGNVTAKVGDEVDAVVRGRDEGGGLLLSIKLGQGQKALEELRFAYEKGRPVDGIVTALNKGGVEVKVGGLRGFCPMSQLDLRYVEDPSQFVQQTLAFLISKFEESPAKGRRPNIVLSRRAVLEVEAQQQASETRANLQLGAVLHGTVSSLTDYGAFIDLGGLDGLLHVSEIDHVRVAHPKDVLQVGQRIEVKITKIEASKDGKRPERISLSRRALAPDPWKQAAESIREGDTVPGKIVRLETFGAFVSVAPGVDGLVHISELGAGRRVDHPKEVVQPGQEVEVRVISLDLNARRISLSMAPEGQSHGGSGGGGGGGGRGRGRGRGESDPSRGDRGRRRPSGPPQVTSSTGGGTFGAMADFFKRAQEEAGEDS